MDIEDTKTRRKTPLTQRKSAQAHNLRVTGSKPVGGTSPYRVHRSVWTTPRMNRRQINRHGAEEARGAHNSEDTGSKPVAGTSPYRVHRSVWTLKTRRQKTGVV
jgi:hypothetical protein